MLLCCIVNAAAVVLLLLHELACTVMVATRWGGAKLALVNGTLGENRGMHTARRAAPRSRRLL